jgi:hypothetical protein
MEFFFFSNGDKYEGDWKDNKRDGEGKFINKKGRYEGEFKDDLKEGKGTFFYNNGNVYDGYYKDNHKVKGLGTLYDSYGNIIED